MIFMLYVLFLRFFSQYLCMERYTQKTSYPISSTLQTNTSISVKIHDSRIRLMKKNNKKRIKRKVFPCFLKITDFKSKEREKEEEKVEIQRIFVWFWFLCVLEERMRTKKLLVKDSLSYRSFEVDRIILHFQHHHIHRS